MSRPSPASELPGGWRVRTPGTILVRRPMHVDGRPRDHVEAARDFAHEPWASTVRYIGAARSWHVYERPADAPKRGERKP